MFSVERFGVGPSAAGGGAGGGGGGGEERGDKRVSALLQKSQERLKKKDLEAEQAKKVTLLRQKAANNAKKNIAKAELKSSNGKRKLESRVMETEEDRKKRKAEAKQAKKERKAKQRMDPEAEPNTEVNNEDDDEEDEEESSERSAQNHDNKKASDDEEVDEEEDETEIPEAQSSKSTVFASILQQLDPNRTKKESKVVNIPTKAAQLSAKLGDVPDANQVGSEGPMDVAIEDKDDKVDTVDVSNQYSLEDNSTPEVFVPVSVQESVKEWGVDPKLAETLIDDGINRFFPVQTAVLPLLLNSAKRPYLQPRDICVSAPTGSGKTLSYALPIIQTLRSRKVTRLRALVMLPSRELASQVHRVFCHLASHTDLMIALTTGTTNLETEREMLVDSNLSKSSLVDILVCTPGRLLDHLQGTAGFTLEHCQYLVLDEADRLLGNAYDHWVRTLIRNTGAVNSVQSSRDLAMTSFQFKQNGGDSLSSRTESGIEIEPENMVLQVLQKVDKMRARRTSSDRGFSTRQNFLQRLLFSATLTDNPRKLSLLGIHNPLIIRTSLLPADILSRRNIAASDDSSMGDKNSATITTSDNTLKSTGYLLPSTLTETVLICEAAARPLTLIALLHEAILQMSLPVPVKKTEESTRSMHVGLCNGEGQDATGTVLIFASSVESAHRLCRLLQLYNGQLTTVLQELDNDQGSESGDNSSDEGAEEKDVSSLLFGGEVKEMTRIVNADDRAATMDKARQGQVRIIVSSDQLARGIDLASVKLVINYDPPKHPRTYVHRVGRTARANRAGHSITMLKLGHMGEFKKLRNAIDDRYDEVGKSKVSKKTTTAVESQYQVAIKHLSTIIDAEADGSLRPGSH